MNKSTSFVVKILSSLSLIIAVAAYFIMTSIPNESTLLNATHVDMTDGVLHILIKGKRIKYTFGTEKVVERPNYLLNYTLSSKKMKLYGPLSDINRFTYIAINNQHQLLREYTEFERNNNSKKPQCLYQSLDLSQQEYQWLEQPACRNKNLKAAFKELPPTNRNSNLDYMLVSPAIPGTYGALIANEQISDTLNYKRPGMDGGYYQVIDQNNNIVAEQKSMSKSEQAKLMDASFEFSENNPLNQLDYMRGNKILGFLPNGDMLMAFEFTWSAKPSLVIISWDLTTNTTRLLDRIYYLNLFSPSTFALRHVSGWNKIKSFPHRKRHSIIKLHSID